MQRHFTKKVGRFHPGETFEYPKPTWDQIERNAGKKLDTFTLPGPAPARKDKDTSDGATSPRA